MAERYSLPLEALGVDLPLPYSTEAEQAVLGAIIADSTTLYDVMDILAPEHFYHSNNSEIYKHIVLMFTAGRSIDFVTVLDAVVSAGVFPGEEDAKMYLYGITETVPTLTNVMSYAQIVYDKYLLRSLIAASREIMNSSSGTAMEDATALLDFAEQKIYDIRNKRDTGDMGSLEVVLMEALEHLSKLSGPDRHKYLGIKTSYSYLDSTLTGLNKSDLIILAARPGVGKTSFALNIAANVAKTYPDISVAMFSLEMTKRQLAERLLSRASGIESKKFRTGEIESDEYPKITEASERLAGAKIYLDDTSGISVPQIKAKARRIRNLGLIIVDYLQLMGGNTRSESRVQEISDITRAFKIMAKELNVPVILLSQLSRSSEKQGQRKPLLSDLRDSGSIEQDADIVLFLHREKPSDEADDAQDTYVPIHDEPDAPDGFERILLMIAKNRHGEIAEINMNFDGKLTEFWEIDYRHD